MIDCAKCKKYMTQHPHYSAVVNVLLGMGLGVLLTYPIVQEHPLRWAAAFIILAVLGYINMMK